MNDETIAQIATNTIVLEGKIAAIDLLLRPIWTNLTLSSSDPLHFMNQTVDGIWETMLEVAPPTDEAMQIIYESARQGWEGFDLK